MHESKMKQDHKRFVAHFDMLGMKQAILRNDNEAWGALCDINEAKKRIYRISIEVKNKDMIVADRVRTFFFSDTVIIFTLSDELEDLYAILILSSELFSNSFHRCVPLRGGLAHGEFYFNLDESLFLGKPLVKAYEIGECAQWIGIVVDEFIAEMAEPYPIGEEIIQWNVPQKDNTFKREFVLNWPWFFRNNFTIKPVTIAAFLKPLYPYSVPMTICQNQSKLNIKTQSALLIRYLIINNGFENCITFHFTRHQGPSGPRCR